MGRLIVTEFMTVDGVMEAPGMDEHRAGGTPGPCGSATTTCRCSTRISWRPPRRSCSAAPRPDLGGVLAVPQGRGVVRRRVNDLPKYVVSKSLTGADWEHTTILRGDPAEEAAALKARSMASSSSTGARTSSRH